MQLILYTIGMNSPLGGPERRKHQRFQIALRVELSEGMGTTRDLSVCGMFFETDRSFVVGEIIEFTLVLEYLDPCQPVRLQGQGRVVRVERHNHLVGVAVAIMAYRIDRHPRSASSQRGNEV